MSRPSSLILIILLVSAAHATVHLLEQSIASVELVICADFGLRMKESGGFGFALRLPYGIGAVFAGLLADRFGEKRILVLYLLGAAGACFGFRTAGHPAALSVLLVSLGAFASMYHPAGLALLANSTTPATRARALGLHGVFGSLGIASAPFIAGLVLRLRDGAWQDYYTLLGSISLVLGLVILWRLHPPPAPARLKTTAEHRAARHSYQWVPYLLLVSSAAISGLIYGGVLHFLPRYLEESGTFRALAGDTMASAGNFAAALALACGAAGQWSAGRIAVARILPIQLAGVYASNIPLLIWMAYADGVWRLAAAGLWAFFHFMNQPLYNALVSEFMAVGRRSFGFGFSNMMGFGVGAIGPGLVAYYDESVRGYTNGYLFMAVLAVAAALIPLAVLSNHIAVREAESSR